MYKNLGKSESVIQNEQTLHSNIPPSLPLGVDESGKGWHK